ncbi:MAG: helix-turn-helix transcriptional regulator [Pseudomonadota bacterium]
MFNESHMDQIFHALSHETRRKILDLLRDRPGQGVGVLARSFDVSRIAIMNHLTVLEKAGLVISEKDGRSRLLYLNLVPLQMIHERWSDEYGAHWAGRLTTLKNLAEQKAAQGGEKT